MPFKILKNENQGVTLVEALVFMGIIALLSYWVISPIASYYNRQALDRTTASMVSILTEARALTLSSKKDTTYGVHIDSDKVTVFKGVVYNSNDTANEVTTLSPLVSVTSSLAGGVSDVKFSRLTGVTANTGTITVSLVRYPLQTKIITIYATGIVEKN